MERNLSWLKAYIVSIALHFLIALLFALGLAEVAAEKEQQMYVVDLATSDFSQGSGHAGGGGGGGSGLAAAFPEPLNAEEMAKRVETVQQAQTFAAEAETLPKPAETPLTPSVVTPSDAVDPRESTAVPDTSVSPAATPLPGLNPSGSGSGGGLGTGTGTGTGSGIGSGNGSGIGSGSGSGVGSGIGDGQGSGSGSGDGQGSGEGNIAGTGNAPFDSAGFRAAVDANKQYPYAAMKRHLEGSVTVSCIVDSSGNITNVSLEESSGQSLLDEAAVEAVRSVGSYPNPTGQPIPVSVPVNFHLR